MGIFSREYLEEVSTDLTFLDESSIELMREQKRQYLFESLFNKLDLIEEEMLEDESGIVTENFIEDFKDAVDELISLITKGREATYKETAKKAQEASNYLSEIKRNLTGSNKTKKSTEFMLQEFHTDTYSTGDSILTVTTYRNPRWSFNVLDFNSIYQKIKDMIKNGNTKSVKALLKPYKKEVFEFITWAPTINFKKIPAKYVDEAATLLSKKIDEHKKATENYGKSVEKMLTSYKHGKDLIKNITEPGVASQMKKFLKVQLSLYRHDTNLLNTYNTMIIKQSRWLRDFVKKNT